MNVGREVKGKQDDTAENKTTCCRWAGRVEGRLILMKSRTPLVSPCAPAWVCAGICTCDESSPGQFDGCWNSKRRSSSPLTSTTAVQFVASTVTESRTRISAPSITAITAG